MRSGQWPLRTGIILGVLVGSFLWAESATAGTVTVQSVVLDAIGAKHGYAEYIISLADSNPSPAPISSMRIGFLTGMPGASTSVAEVLNIPSAEVKQIQASMRFALFVPAPDIHQVSIHYSAIDQHGATTNDDAQIDVLTTDSTPLRFDDSSSWIGAIPSAFAFLPSTAPGAGPAAADPPGLPKVAEVTVRVYFDASGSVVSAKVVSWAAMGEMDSAVLDEARKTRISPALLITPEGNEPTPTTIIILYTFINDQPG